MCWGKAGQPVLPGGATGYALVLVVSTRCLGIEHARCMLARLRLVGWMWCMLAASRAAAEVLGSQGASAAACSSACSCAPGCLGRRPVSLHVISRSGRSVCRHAFCCCSACCQPASRAVPALKWFRGMCRSRVAARWPAARPAAQSASAAATCCPGLRKRMPVAVWLEWGRWSRAVLRSSQAGFIRRLPLQQGELAGCEIGLPVDCPPRSLRCLAGRH